MRRPFLIGERIYLRGLERSDLSGPMLEWADDSDVTRFLVTGLVPNATERLEAEYDHLVRSPNDVVLAVVEQDSDRHIGNVGLYDISWVARHAEFRILIGEKAQWGRGIGGEATRLTVGYGFDKLNLNKVWLGVNAENERAVRAYERAGFAREGVLREEVFRNGRYYDAVRMSILRREYQAPRG